MFWYIVLILVVAMVFYCWKTLQPHDPSEAIGGSWDQWVRKDVQIKKRVDNTAEYYKTYDTQGLQVLMMYASEYGFSEQVSRKLCLQFRALPVAQELKIQPRLVNIKDAPNYVDLTKEQVLLFTCSTTGDGVPPADSRPLFDAIERNELKLNDKLHYSVLALGDSAYPHFCRAGKILDKGLATAGATQIVPRVDIDLEDWTAINGWFDRCVAAIVELARSGKLNVTDDYLHFLPPPVSATGSKGFDRNRPYPAALITKRNLTSIADKNDKETIHVEFDLGESKLSYTPGDALGIMPLNNPPEVQAVIDVMRAREAEVANLPNPITNRPANQDEKDEMAQDKVSLRTLLTRYYDLKKVRPELVTLLAQNAADAKEQQLGKELLAQGTSKNNQQLNAFLKNREVVDVLEAFPSAIASTDLPAILAVLRPLQPRYYSISSCPQTNPGRVHCTIAIVRYSTLNKPRTGVCTTYLQDRVRIGGKVAVFMSHNHEFRLPEDPKRPIIMIGPGTGLAPFRAFLQNRVITNAPGLNVLYFGCRSRNQDYLYGEELESFASKGQVELRLAFSRDQKEKIYVQHLIAQDEVRIWKLLQENAHIYVCGDGANMANDVHAALLQIIMKQSGCDKNGADQFMERLVKEKRYQRDVWVT